MGAHPLYASVCVGYVGLVAHSQNIGIGIGSRLELSSEGYTAGKSMREILLTETIQTPEGRAYA